MASYENMQMYEQFEKLAVEQVEENKVQLDGAALRDIAK